MTSTEQNQERIDRQMQTITAQARTIANQAERISALYVLLQKALEHAPEFVKHRTAKRLGLDIFGKTRGQMAADITHKLAVQALKRAGAA